MNLKQKILSYALSAGMAVTGAAACTPMREFYNAGPITRQLNLNQTISVNPVDKYAVLVCGLSDGNTKYNKNVAPIDKDCESLALFRLYKHLSSAGFKDKNVRILYSTKDKDPNFDAGNKDLAKRVKEKHFSGQYNTNASKRNIETILNKFKKKADSNDKVVFYLLAHGDSFGNIYLERSKIEFLPELPELTKFLPEIIWPMEFQKYLNGWKSKHNLFMIMNCYGGATVDKVNVNNVFLFAATQSKKANWCDRFWDAGVQFLKNKLDEKNDTNKDGVVDCDETTAAVQKEAQLYWSTFLRELIKTDYKGGTDNPDFVSLMPKTKKGKNFKKANLK